MMRGTYRAIDAARQEMREAEVEKEKERKKRIADIESRAKDNGDGTFTLTGGDAIAWLYSDD